MSEVADVTDILEAFETHNKVRIECRLTLIRTSKGPDLSLMMAAHEEGVEIGEVPSLASVNVKCSATNLKTLSSALTHAMYALDFQLALNEMESASTKRA